MAFVFLFCFFMFMVVALVTAGVLIYVFLIKDSKKPSGNNNAPIINQPLYNYPRSVQQQYSSSVQQQYSSSVQQQYSSSVQQQYSSSVQQQPVTSYYQAQTYYPVNYYDENNIKGIYGEFSCYSKLKGFEQTGARFVTNVYIPKNGTETTEIDLVMICQHGLFVIESKNFSGWIFGGENQTKWTQTLPNRWTGTQKQYFYNPIKQNRGHIKHLCNYLSEDFPVYSIIVFSDDCTLKSVTVTSSDVVVVYESNLFRAVNWICGSTRPTLSQDDIVRIYNKLYPLTQVNMAVRQQHVANIQSRFDNTKR